MRKILDWFKEKFHKKSERRGSAFCIDCEDCEECSITGICTLEREVREQLNKS